MEPAAAPPADRQQLRAATLLSDMGDLLHYLNATKSALAADHEPGKGWRLYVIDQGNNVPHAGSTLHELMTSIRAI